MRDARKYDRRVQIYVKSEVSDGFGGATLTNSLLAVTWANISTIRTDKLQDYGLDETRGVIKIHVRHRNDIDFNDENLFFVYRDQPYEIVSVVETDLRRTEFEIIAATSSVSVQESGTEIFDESFDTTFR